tara:strand:- start:171 stop:1289 length:1119 start_codon:yes stop_codon:yes gene_type:complete
MALPYFRKIVKKQNKKLFNTLIDKKFFQSLSYIMTPTILLISFRNTDLNNFKSIATELSILQKVLSCWIIIATPMLVNKFLSAVSITYKANPFFIKYPINSYLQLFKLLIIIIAFIVLLCLILNLSPWGILSGIGALGAILLLVFKDTILGLVASIQVYGGGLVKEGDWIELKSLDIDGEVLEVGLHRVKVKAWDNTITTFPTAKFLDLTFKNWRGMTESGGRRIKRQITLKTSSIKFIDNIFIEKLSKFLILSKYLEEKKKELLKANKFIKEGTVNKRSLTNVGCFRAYVREYLKSHTNINKNMTILVRQLPINHYGLPIEIYAFTSTTNWNDYEDIQSDIFDHLLASVKYFDLIVYQQPASEDIKNLLKQ